MASLNALRVEAETWVEEVGRVRAAAAPAVAELAPVDAAHRAVVSPETARAVSALLASQRVPEPELPRLRLLVRFLQDASLAAATRGARQALEAAWWRSAPGSGLESSLAEVEADLPRSDERAVRLEREGTVNRGWEALLGNAQRLQAGLADAAGDLGATDLPALIDARRDSTWATLDLDGFLRSTEDAYRDVLGWAMGKVAPRLAPSPRGDATLADLDRVRALPGYPGALEQADEALQAWAMRLPDAAGRARHLRTRTVPAAAARVIPVEVPERIELLLPGRGAAACDLPARFSWMAAPCTSPPSSPRRRWSTGGWEIRRWWSPPAGWCVGCCGTSAGCGEPFSWDGRRRVEVARMEALVALATLRAEAALQPLLRQIAVAGPTLHRLGEAAEAVASALHVRVGRGRVLAMVAGLDLTQRQLRAAALASCLWAEADRRFDADEFRNPVAARWLAALWSRGAPEPPEQMAPALCASPLGLEKLGGELVAVLGA